MKAVHQDDPRTDLTPEEALDAEDALGQRLGEDRSLIELVRFGLDMEEFTRTHVGKYLVHRAEGELNEATKVLLDLNDLAGKDAADAHMQARVALKVLRWLDDVVQQGREAERSISERDHAGQPVDDEHGR